MQRLMGPRVDQRVEFPCKDELMTDKNEAAEKKAVRLAETTDVSPRKAKPLMKKPGKERREVEKAAENLKAEG